MMLCEVILLLAQKHVDEAFELTFNMNLYLMTTMTAAFIYLFYVTTLFSLSVQTRNPDNLI